MKKTKKSSKASLKVKKKVLNGKNNDQAQLTQPDQLAHIPDELKNIIRKNVEKFIKILEMDQYKHRIFYQKKTTGDNNKVEYAQSDAGYVMATADINTRYMTLDINIYPFLVDSWGTKEVIEEDIEDIIAHEVSHLATQHLYELATLQYKSERETRDEWEKLTTIIGRLLCKIDNLKRLLTNSKLDDSIKK